PVGIGEGYGVKAELLENFRKGFVVHQSTHGYAGGCRNPKRVGAGDAVRNASMQTSEPTVEVMLGQAVAVDRHQQALESSSSERLDVVGQEPAVGDQPALDTCLGCHLHEG